MTIPAEHPLPSFGPGSSFAVGVEEELHVVDADTLAPWTGTDQLLERLPQSAARAGGELFDGVVELAAPTAARAAQAATVLGELRGAVARQGPALLGAGLHPLAAFGDVRHRAGHRYDRLARAVPGVVGQAACCGLRVHVGMPDAETAIRACNGMRKWMPLLQALGANSPFWYGQDSGMASARALILSGHPRSGIPRPLRDYADFQATVEDLGELGDGRDFSLLWWDVRPHPRLGTLEIRAFDAQSSLDDLAALVALAHCLAVHEVTAPPEPAMSPEALRTLSFAAARDGLDARVPFERALMPVVHAAHLTLMLIGHTALELGCWDELMCLRRLLELGNGAARQRRAAATGTVAAAVEMLAAETRARGPASGLVPA